MMNFEKTNESWDRTFVEGHAADNVLKSVSFNVKNADGEVIGEAHVNNSQARLNLNIYGFNSVEEGVAKLKETVGITDEAGE